MNKRREFWDFPPTMRRPRIEYLPPEPEPPRLIIEFRHRRNGGISWHWLVIAGAVLLLVRRPLVWLMLFALVGPDYCIAIAVTVLILAVAAWRERRRGRPF